MHANGPGGGRGLASASGRILNAQLFDVTSREPRVLVGAALVLLVVGIVAPGYRLDAPRGSIR